MKYNNLDMFEVLCVYAPSPELKSDSFDLIFMCLLFNAHSLVWFLEKRTLGSKVVHTSIGGACVRLGKAYSLPLATG